MVFRSLCYAFKPVLLIWAGILSNPGLHHLQIQCLHFLQIQYYLFLQTLPNPESWAAAAILHSSRLGFPSSPNIIQTSKMPNSAALLPLQRLGNSPNTNSQRPHDNWLEGGGAREKVGKLLQKARKPPQFKQSKATYDQLDVTILRVSKHSKHRQS